MNTIKADLFLASFIFILMKCSNDDKQLPVKSQSEIRRKYDTVAFNKRYFPETAECEHFKNGRLQIDSLSYECAIVKVSSVDTFLATSKYSRLWICNLPPILLIKGDSILLSGKIYSIGGSESPPGWPTVVNEVITK